MSAPIFIPPSTIRRTQKCSCCGLSFPLKENKCTHCGDLNNQELIKLLERVKEQQEGNRRLGFYFGVASAVLLVILIINSI